VQLTLAINVINGWNRLAVGFNLYAPELGWH
jgi:alkylhydroperoxidase family enzyme